MMLTKPLKDTNVVSVGGPGFIVTRIIVILFMDLKFVLRFNVTGALSPLYHLLCTEIA